MNSVMQQFEPRHSVYLQRETDRCFNFFISVFNALALCTRINLVSQVQCSNNHASICE